MSQVKAAILLSPIIRAMGVRFHENGKDVESPSHLRIVNKSETKLDHGGRGESHRCVMSGRDVPRSSSICVQGCVCFVLLLVRTCLSSSYSHETTNTNGGKKRYL